MRIVNGEKINPLSDPITKLIYIEENVDWNETKRCNMYIEENVDWNEMKRCNLCGNIKPKSEFNKCSNSPDGTLHRCKECLYWRYIYRTYKLTKTQYQKMLKYQKNKCFICKKDFNDISNMTKSKIRHICVDHDKDTGIVRSLLCRNCNSTEGWFRLNSDKINFYLENNLSIEKIQYKNLGSSSTKRYKKLTEEIVKKQLNKCAICDQKLYTIYDKRGFYKQNYHLDHSHTSGLVRGVLCFQCNVRLGWFELYKNRIRLNVNRGRTKYHIDF